MKMQFGRNIHFNHPFLRGKVLFFPPFFDNYTLKMIRVNNKPLNSFKQRLTESIQKCQ